MHTVKRKKDTILAFCVYSIVISDAFTVGITGLIALATAREKLLIFAKAETEVSLKIYVYHVNRT